MEYEIPTLEGYKLTDDCQVVSYRRKRKVLTPVPNKPFSFSNRVETLYCLRQNGRSKNFRLHRIILAVKLNRWPESWENARHIDGDHTNNSFNNIKPGCFLLNIIDDFENGTRCTTPENIDEAIARLEKLKLTLEF